MATCAQSASAGVGCAKHSARILPTCSSLSTGGETACSRAFFPRVSLTDTRVFGKFASFATSERPDVRGSEAPNRPHSRRSDDVADADVVVVGAGVGGLACAALLAWYGVDVVVCESHGVPGGAAHTWTRKGYRFDCGTSLFSGLRWDYSGKRSENPLSAVLRLIRESVDVVDVPDEATCLVWPDRQFRTHIGSVAFRRVVENLWGRYSEEEWRKFQAECDRLSGGAAAIKPMAVRFDNAVGITTVFRTPGAFLKYLLGEARTMMFSDVVDSAVSDPGLREFVDLLTRGTCGLPSNEILASYMIQAFQELYKPSSHLEYPIGGPQAIVDALVRGLLKFGGRLVLHAHVQEVVVGRDGQAAGVRLKDGRTIHANQAVVSNASAWDTMRLVPSDYVSKKYKSRVDNMILNNSFMHVHLGFDGDGLGPLPLHYYMFDPELTTDSGWPTIAVPSAVDPSAAPSGKHVLHAYVAEPFAPWVGLDRRSKEYKERKAERSQVVWDMVSRVIPDIRDRVELEMVGTPLTHQHFLNRHHGTFGPKNLLKMDTFPEAVCPLPRLYCCGDSTFPGAGTPAVASSGMWVANSLVSVWDHWSALDVLGF